MGFASRLDLIHGDLRRGCVRECNHRVVPVPKPYGLGIVRSLRDRGERSLELLDHVDVHLEGASKGVNTAATL